MRVRALMDATPVLAALPASRRDVQKLLARHHLSGVPVVHAGARTLAGVVTRGDLTRRPEEQDVAAVMASNPLVIDADAEAIEAARIFQHHRIHTLPVLDGSDVVGVITPLHLLPATTSTAPIGGYLRETPIPLHQDATMRMAWATMRLTGAYALPVLDDDAKLVGIVADSDLFDDVPRAEQATLPKRPVRDVMVRAVITAGLRDTVQEAAQRMAKARVKQLPVVERGELVGLLTDLDLMRAWFP